MGIYLWWPIIISDMQWPAPDGFHVPLSSEWVSLCWILTGTFWLASNATTMGTYLKMPMAGRRENDSATVNFVGSNGYYWSSTPYNTNSAYYLHFSRGSISQQNYLRAYGLSVRCFKNAPTVPTSSWTKLYWTSIESWGIFWNSALWLISLSSDWTTRITIMDKNLWATTVWNSWDTLSEANCGWYFQWGNNYVFPFTWSVTTSTTKRDTSAYWPWRYYRSSTFITWVADRSRVQNDNLWWWVSQWSTTKSVELKNAYIGEYYEYVYDFRNKTVAWIQSDGWTFETTSNFYVDANGLYNSSNTMRKIIYPVDVSNASKITIFSTTIGSWTRDCSVWLSSTWTEEAITYYYSGWISWYINPSTTFGYVSIGNWTAEVTEEFDLVNKTVKYVCPLANLNTTLTLTDTQIATIRWATNLFASIDRELRLADISIIIE